MSGNLYSKNVTIAGRRTSVRLEKVMWESIGEICQREGMNVHELCTEIDRRRAGSSRTSAIRAFIVIYFRAAASQSGHSRSGHGRLVEDMPAPRRRRENSSFDFDGALGPVS